MKKYRWEFDAADRFKNRHEVIEEFERFCGTAISNFRLARIPHGYDIIKMSGGLEKRVFELVIAPAFRGGSNMALQLTPHVDDIATRFATVDDESLWIVTCEAFIKYITANPELPPSQILELKNEL